MSIPYWLVNPKPKVKKCDVLILGSGISGLGVGYWLSKLQEPFKDHPSILVVDKQPLGFGASGRNAGFISTGSLALFNQLVEKYGMDQALTMKKFYKRNHDLLNQCFGLKEKKHLQYVKAGSVSISLSEGDHNPHKKELVDAGFDFKELSPEDVRNNLGFQGSFGGHLDPADGQIHSYNLLKEIKKQSPFVDFLNQEEIYKIEDGIAYSPNYIIEFKKIIYALNGYSPILVPEIKDFIRPIRGQMLTLSPGKTIMKHNAYASKKLCYFRQLKNGEFLIGGFRRLEEASEVGYCDAYTTEPIQSAFKTFIQEHLPELASRPVGHQWAGIMGFSYDENPLVGKLSKDKFFIGGYTGHGMGKAFACAEALAQLILNEKPLPEFIDLSRLTKT